MAKKSKAAAKPAVVKEKMTAKTGSTKATATKKKATKRKAPTKKKAPTKAATAAHRTDPTSAKWFKLDSGAPAAMTGGGLFLLATNGTSWTWYPSESDTWDAIHQRIYRQQKADSLPGPPPGAPPLPAEGTAAPRVDPAGAIARDPSLVAWIGQGRTAFLTLEEDTYESTFGDGVFREMVGCFPTEAEALTCAVHTGCDRHVRRVELVVKEGVVRASSERVDYADRYRMEDVLASLADRVR